MAKKLGPPLVLGIFTILALVFLTGGATDDKDPLRENFQINAIYYDAGYVEVSYIDKSDKTNSVILEILGMETSFQKTFSDSEFIEIIPISKCTKIWLGNPSCSYGD